MITTNEAYALGYFPQVIGFYFHGFEILGQVQMDPDPDLRARVDFLLKSWPSRQVEVSNQIRNMDRILSRLGIVVNGVPTNYEQYIAWVSSILKDVPCLFLVSFPNSVISKHWAYVFASKLGDFVLMIRLCALIQYLLGSKVPHLFLTNQKKHLYQMSKETWSQLKNIKENITRMNMFPHATQRAVSQSIHLIESAPLFEDSNEDPGHLAVILQKLVSDLEQLDIQKQFQF